MISNPRELLAMPTDAFNRPSALKEGHYIGVIGDNELGNTKGKNTPYVRFKITPTEATSDVEDYETVDLTNRELRKDYYITPASLWRLRAMLDAVLGPVAGTGFDERIPYTRGVRVIVKVTVRRNENTDEEFNDVETIISAEEE